ncbi:MAG TPA: BadF/BadG/BcrA/BcrD ATPase family protein [Candidatus Limnocylindrales bacterium]|jgi:N-acetylglucosamine kinase-like BadF-type ATPase
MDGLLAGVDGGNTKTIALVARPDGTIVGAGRALGCADIHAVAVERALPVVARALDAASKQVDEPVRHVAFSMAGADWDEDHVLLAERLGERWPVAAVVNDAIGALRAAIPEGPGVVVVCGTGAATGARGPDGSTWHSSFWQEPQGASELGTRALLAVVAADLGIAPPTSLRDAFLRALGESSVEAVLHRWTHRERHERTDKVDPAVLAPLLLDAAEANDPVAVEIVDSHGRALGRTALAATRRVGIGGGPFHLALAGGVFRHPARHLADALVRTVRETAPSVEVVAAELEPAAGALLLAFDAAGIAVDEGVERRLRASLPKGDLYDTYALPAAASRQDAAPGRRARTPS